MHLEICAGAWECFQHAFKRRTGVVRSSFPAWPVLVQNLLDERSLLTSAAFCRSGALWELRNSPSTVFLKWNQINPRRILIFVCKCCDKSQFSLSRTLPGCRSRLRKVAFMKSMLQSCAWKDRVVRRRSLERSVRSRVIRKLRRSTATKGVIAGQVLPSVLQLNNPLINASFSSMFLFPTLRDTISLGAFVLFSFSSRIRPSWVYISVFVVV